MGIPGLLKAVKAGCSSEVDLTHGGKDSTIIIDGGYLLHKLVNYHGAAAALMQEQPDLGPLAAECVKFVHSLEDAGWKVVVVFDGDSPPAKAATAAGRREKRESAAASYAAAVNPGERDKFAKQAVSISKRLRARIGRILQRSCQCETLFAPFEADAQLVFMEAEFVRMGQRCYVFATDADLLVIGVRQLAWEIKVSTRGKITAQVITRDALFQPSSRTLEHAAEGSFVRQLHGIPEGCDNPQLQCATVVNDRLLDLGCIAGNDYISFKGLGFGTAARVALPSIVSSDYVRDAGQVKEVLVKAAAAKLVQARLAAAGEEATHLAMEGIQMSVLMFRHSVVLNQNTGLQQRHHPLGDASPEEEDRASLSTGPVECDKKTCLLLAAGVLSPGTSTPWDPPLENDPSLARHGKRGRVSTSNSRAEGDTQPLKLPGRAGGRPTTPAFPPPNELFGTWHLDPLKQWLSRFRCVEHAGISSSNKAQAVSLAESIMDMVRNMASTDDHLLLREETEGTTPTQRLNKFMPGMPSEREWIHNHLELRPFLPYLHESVIISFLSGVAGPGNLAARNLYRGLQRALDLGGVGGLSGKPPPREGGEMWLRLRARASMVDDEYNVYAKVEVTRVLTEAAAASASTLEREGMGAGGEHCEDGEYCGDAAARMVATRILSAFCECRAGAAARCHHIAMLLQLIRLLKMSAREISEFDPATVTTSQARWVLDHCKGGREAKDNMWWGRTLTDVYSDFSKLRDPKGQGFGSGELDGSKTAGVVQGNRSVDYNPHPGLGKWAQLRDHFDEGSSISHAQSMAFDDFFSAIRDAKRANPSSKRNSTDTVPLGVDVLPPRVRLA